MKQKLKVALISSWTADFLPRIISQEAEKFGVLINWYVAPFNQISQEVKQLSSPSKKFNPDIIFLLFPPGISLIKEYAANFPYTHIFVNNAYLLEPEVLSLYKINNPKSLYYQTINTNQKLIKLVSKIKNIHLLDFGRFQSFFDPKYYYLAKIPFNQEGLQEIGKLLARAIVAVLGKRIKCLVLDLDNILWGGILAEDGLEHLKLDINGEGRAFYDFQNAILELYNSGIILAICSKNAEKMALKAIRELPHMLLREDKFAAIRINWLNKAQNIRSIAQELNLGLDSLVFLDDTSFEQSVVQKLIPEVLVPKMPADFSLYPSFLAKLPFLDAFSFTNEDSKRGQLYVQERKRKELKENANSFIDFLHSLRITVSIKKIDKWSLPRVAQLTQKTNQFNLSLNRYQEIDIAQMLKEKGTKVLYLSTKDNLGDAGIVGAAIFEINNKEAFLDTFLMSCRVLQRGIEEAFIHKIAKLAQKSGAKKLKARYNSTQKNMMVKTFLLKVGFKESEGFFWLDLQKIPSLPVWIKIIS